MKLIDLSHSVEDGLVTYRGLPAPKITTWMSYESSRGKYDGCAEFRINTIEILANTGTYIDAPSHRVSGGVDIGNLPLESLAALPGIVIDHGDEIAKRDAGAFEGRAVLIRTNWSRHWNTEAYFDGSPFITRAEAELLASSGAKLVGIDSLNIDDTRDASRPAHTILLQHGVPVLEHLTNLHLLPEEGFEVFAVPPKLKGMDTFTVRAFALIR
jgi:kynurenine formamidase